MYKYLNFTENDVNEIVKMVADKYYQARLILPNLSDRFEDHDFLTKIFNRFVNRENFLVLKENEKIIGFMNAIYLDDFKGSFNGALVLPFMHGVVEGFDKNQIYQLMYRYLSEKWADAGYYTHCILLNVNEELTFNMWFEYGFGMLCMDVVRSMDDIIVKEEDDIVIRKAEKSDLVNMIEIFEGINQHLSKAPIFLYNDFEGDYLKRAAKWLDEDENNNFWIAILNEEIIGYLKTNTNSINLEELMDGKTLGINGAFVKEKYRGRQITSRLINEALKWGRMKGLVRLSSDFETANIEGKTYWLKHFSRYQTALIRRIDERNHLNKFKD